MKFKNLVRWDIKPELDGLLFFAQRMDELLWAFTPDVHKPPTLNAPSLCREALELLGDIEAELMDALNLKHVLEELISSIQKDPVAKKLLDLPVEYYVPMSDGVKLSERRIKLEVLARTLEEYRYLNECFDQLYENVKLGRKKKIDHLARNMLTTLINMQVSKEFVYQKNNDYFFSSEGTRITSCEDLRPYLKSLYPVNHECYAYFIVSDLIDNVKESVGAFRIKLGEKLPEDVSAVATANNFFPKDDEVYVRVGPVSSFDVYSAHQAAASKLDSLSDLFTLFYHKKKISWSPRAIVEQCCLDAPTMITATMGAMEKPFDLLPEKASKELNRFLRNFAARGISFERFNRVADLHGVCISIDVVENQLVNLWTSIETLVPSHAGNTKINKILDSMLPFLMLNSIYKMIQRLNHDLIVWRRWTAKKILNKVPNVQHPDMMSKMLALLCVKGNEDLRQELYAEAGDFHLLRFRVFQLSEILSSPSSLQLYLKGLDEKFRWQIRRIYRTRNMIVHSGSKPVYVRALVENGHDYLDRILFDVMILSCGEYRAKTLEQAFHLAQVKYKAFTDGLAAIEEFDAINCMFLREGQESLGDYVFQHWE